jgi:hypothetical protein
MDAGLIAARFLHLATVMALFGLVLFPLYSYPSRAARGQFRWITHWPPAALSLPQNWLASPADANGPTMSR